jgi:hypothetical protein
MGSAIPIRQSPISNFNVAQAAECLGNVFSEAAASTLWQSAEIALCAG